MTMHDDQIPVLLVDDEPGIRKVLGIALSDRGHAVQTAGSAKKALELIDGMPTCIVLTDIKMPGMDGITLLKAIKRIQPNSEVIMITGHGDMDLAIQSLKYDALDFITKPINDTVLETALQRARERISMRTLLDAYTQRLEEMVAEKTRQLLDAERMAAIGETVAGLSHAIKNITTGLKGGSFVVEKGIELDNRQYLLEGWGMVRTNVTKIGRLSLDLLNYAKSATMVCQWCDPNEPVNEIAALMAPRAEDEGIELDITLRSDNGSVFFDPDAIHRALLNLVTNAMDACHNRQKAKVHFLVDCTKDGGVKYTVKDNGCGMDKETRQRLFQNFFTTKGDDGTGIGLIMTRNIIEKHNGTIEVTSREDAGSEFVIHLPARTVPRDNETRTQAARQETP